MAIGISDDPAEIAAVRAAADAQAEALAARAMETVRGGGYVTGEQSAALRHRRARSVAELADLADSAALPSEARLVAATTLGALGDAGGPARVVGLLAHPSPEVRAAAVKRLNSAEGGGVTAETPGLAATLLRIVGDADELAARTAAHVATLHGIPAEAAVVARLDAGPVADRLAWVSTLSEVAQTPESSARAAAELFRDPPPRYWGPPTQFTNPQEMHRLYWVLNHRDPAVSAPARSAARAFLLRYPEARYSEEWAANFWQLATAHDVPLLEDLFENGPKVRYSALMGLERADPAGAVARMVALGKSRAFAELQLDVFARRATEADADAVLRFCRPTPRQLASGHSDYLLEKMIRVALRLGKRGRDELSRWAEQLPDHLRLRAQWVLRGVTVPEVLAALCDAGALPGEPAALLARLGEHDRTVDQGDPFEIGYAFRAAGRGLIFEDDYNPLSRDSDRMRMFTEESTGGLFVPECIAEERHGDEPSAAATVRFVHAGRAFAFDSPSLVEAEWNDASRATAAANAALEASGRPERFLELPGAFKSTLILTEPARYRPVAERYGLPGE